MAQVKWVAGDDHTIVLGDKNWCVGCALNNGVTCEISDVDAHESAHIDFNKPKAPEPSVKAKK